MERLLLRAAAAALALSLAGCAGYQRNVLSEAGNDKVMLRGEKTFGGGSVEKNYDHPVTISGARLAHILSRIDVRTDDDDANSRKPAIPAEIVFELGEKLSNALAKASKDEEVVVIANLKSRQMKFGLSEGMVLAAGNPGGTLRVCTFDEGPAAGDRVS